MLTTPTQTSLTSQPVLLDSLNTLTTSLPPSPIHLPTVSIRSDYSEIQLTLNWVTGSASALFVPQRFDRDFVWGLTRVGPRNHVLDGSPDPQGKGQFWGLPCQFKSFGNLAAVYAKTAEPIKMPFGEGRRNDSRGPKKPCITWGRDFLPWEWTIFGVCPAHSTAEAVSAAVYAAKGIISSSITTACCSRLQCSPSDRSPHDAAFLSKFFDHLFTCIIN